MAAFVPSTNAAGRLPASAGVGFKPQHGRDLLAAPGRVGWIEVHPENYMVAGGPALALLEAARANHPLSLHGVGLSLGSAEGVSQDHLHRLKRLVERYEPEAVSEHVSWSAVGGAFVNDLLPLPYSREALDVITDNVGRTQDALGRAILVENPSTYFAPAGSETDEPEFLIELCRRAGCGLLLDVNNVEVSARNHGWDAAAYLDRIPGDLVGEIHLAGHSIEAPGPDNGWREIRVDDHGSAVSDPVWRLYELLIARIGARPTLIEWDTDTPDFATLAGEADKAARVLAAAKGASANAA